MLRHRRHTRHGIGRRADRAPEDAHVADRHRHVRFAAQARVIWQMNKALWLAANVPAHAGMMAAIPGGQRATTLAPGSRRQTDVTPQRHSASARNKTERQGFNRVATTHLASAA